VVCGNVRLMCWSRVSWEAVAHLALRALSPTMSCTGSMSLDARGRSAAFIPAKRIVGVQIAHLVAISERNVNPGLGTHVGSFRGLTLVLSDGDV
jgi:hypothetical protein